MPYPEEKDLISLYIISYIYIIINYLTSLDASYQYDLMILKITVVNGRDKNLNTSRQKVHFIQIFVVFNI